MKMIRSVGTLIECKGKILILERNEQEKTWALPAGKVEPDEEDIDTAVREILEETGYQTKKEDLVYVTTFDWRFPSVHVTFPTFRLLIQHPFDVRLDLKEHSAYRWITPQECYHLPNLIHGFKNLLETVYHIDPIQ